MKLILRWSSNLVTTILFIIFIFMVFFVVSSKVSGGEPQILGYQLKSVLSGSMEPGIQTGSIIVVKPTADKTSFKEGDIITFLEEENILITHRIIEVIKSGEQVLYRTKGDNNNGPDINPVLSENVVAEYTGFTIPYVGYFINFAQTKEGSALLLILPGLLLLAYSVITTWKAIAEVDAKKTQTADHIEKV